MRGLYLRVPHATGVMAPRERWWAWRNRLLGSARFRAWATAFPPTRPIAQRRAREVFDLCAGFVYSQVLFACVQLRVFDLLGNRAQPLPVLARRLKLSEESAARLLDAAVGLRLVARLPDGRYGLGELGAAIAGNPAVDAMVAHHELLYADLRDPVALLRGDTGLTELARYWPYAAGHSAADLADDKVAAYSALMSASQSLIADEVLAAYDFTRHRRLLDVGGGQGTFLLAAAAKAPALDLVLFDLPAVAERARLALAAAGLGARATCIGGDFLGDALPAGADLVTLIRVLHDQDDAGALALLRAVRRAMPANGTLLVAEPLAETPGAERMGHVYFGFYLLAMGRGRPRSGAANVGLLRAAGFAHAAPLQTRLPLQTGLIVARAC